MLICLLCHFSKQYKTQSKFCLALFLKCLTVTMSFHGQYNSYWLWHSINHIDVHHEMARHSSTKSLLFHIDSSIPIDYRDIWLGFHILDRNLLLLDIQPLPAFLKVIRFFYCKSCTNQRWNQSWFCYCLQSYLVLSSILNIKSRSEKPFKTWRFHIYHKYWT